MSRNLHFFIISSPLLKLGGILTKLTMFIEYFCFGALVRLTEVDHRQNALLGERQ